MKKAATTVKKRKSGNGSAFRATLEPDGQGGHWLKVDRKMRQAAGAPGTPGLKPGDVVTLEIAPAPEEPEPRAPADLRKALAAAAPSPCPASGLNVPVTEIFLATRSPKPRDDPRARRAGL